MKHNFNTDWKSRAKQKEHMNSIEAANRRPLKGVFASHSFLSDHCCCMAHTNGQHPKCSQMPSCPIKQSTCGNPFWILLCKWLLRGQSLWTPPFPLRKKILEPSTLTHCIFTLVPFLVPKFLTCVSLPSVSPTSQKDLSKANLSSPTSLPVKKARRHQPIIAPSSSSKPILPVKIGPTGPTPRPPSPQSQ